MRSLAHQVPLLRQGRRCDGCYAAVTSPLGLRCPLRPAGPEAAVRHGRTVLLSGVRRGRLGDRPRRRRPQRDEVRGGAERLLPPGKRKFCVQSLKVGLALIQVVCLNHVCPCRRKEIRLRLNDRYLTATAEARRQRFVFTLSIVYKGCLIRDD